MKAFAIVISLLVIGPLARAGSDDIFNLSPPHSIGVGTTSSTDGSRVGHVDGSLTLPGDWVLRGLVGRRAVEGDGETAQMGNWRFGVVSDQLATFVFEATIDQEFHRGLYNDSGLELRALYQSLNGWVFGLIAGARSFKFTPDAAIVAKSEYTIGSSLAGIVIEKTFAKTWFARAEHQRFRYPEQIHELETDFALIVVPNDTLTYAYGLPESITRLAVGSGLPFAKKHRPQLTLSLSSSRSAVDGSTSGSAQLDYSMTIARRWLIAIGVGATRTVVDATTSDPIRTGSLAVSYSWR